MPAPVLRSAPVWFQEQVFHSVPALALHSELVLRRPPAARLPSDVRPDGFRLFLRLLYSEDETRVQYFSSLAKLLLSLKRSPLSASLPSFFLPALWQPPPTDRRHLSPLIFLQKPSSPMKFLYLQLNSYGFLLLYFSRLKTQGVPYCFFQALSRAHILSFSTYKLTSSMRPNLSFVSNCFKILPANPASTTASDARSSFPIA